MKDDEMCNGPGRRQCSCVLKLVRAHDKELIQTFDA